MNKKHALVSHKLIISILSLINLKILKRKAISKVTLLIFHSQAIRDKE